MSKKLGEAPLNYIEFQGLTPKGFYNSYVNQKFSNLKTF